MKFNYNKNFKDTHKKAMARPSLFYFFVKAIWNGSAAGAYVCL